MRTTTGRQIQTGKGINPHVDMISHFLQDLITVEGLFSWNDSFEKVLEAVVVIFQATIISFASRRKEARILFAQASIVVTHVDSLGEIACA